MIHNVLCTIIDYSSTEFDTICDGENVYWHNNYYYTTGTYYDTINYSGNIDSTYVLDLLVYPNPVATITATSSTTICDGSSVLLQANSGTNSYEWMKDGVVVSTVTSSYYATQAGSYSVKVTDISNNQGCYSNSSNISVNVNSSDFSVSFAANPTTFADPPYFTVFYNQTPSSSDYSWNWLLGDGNSSTQMSPTHTYTSTGIYTVTAMATNTTTGCVDTLIKPGFITCNSNSNPCPVIAEITPAGPVTICANDSVLLHSVSNNSNYSYQWLHNGIMLPGATDSVFWAKEVGTYKLIVSDTCTNYSSDFQLYKYPLVTPVIQANGTIQPCTDDSLELFVTNSFSSYLWSTGDTTQSIYVKSSGNYVVGVTDVNACSSLSYPYIVNASLLSIPSICIVGVDSVTNHNQIVFERNTSALIDSFVIYRESTVANVYDKIGVLPYSVPGIFIDQNSNPATRAYRYKLSAIDTCNEETPLGDFHKTIHLTINAGLGNSWNLIWDGYDGFTFGSYNIYRSTDSLNMQFLTQIQSTLTSYSDLTPPAGNVFYQIEVVSPHPCYPDSIYAKSNTNYNTSRSNTVNTNMAPNTGFVRSVNNDMTMQVYPNPNKGNFTLEINSSSNKLEYYNIEVYSVMGQLIFTDNIEVQNKAIKAMQFDNLSNGVYFIHLRNDNNVLTTKFVIE